MRITRALFLGLLLLPRGAAAQAPPAPAAPPPPPPKVEGTAEAAFVGLTGNTSSSTFSTSGLLINRSDKWLIRNRGVFIRGEEAGVLTAKSIFYSPRAERSLSARTSAFGEYIYFQDRFAGVSARNTVAGGVSFKAIKTDSQSLSLDVSAGYLNEHRTAGDNISSGIYSLGWGYRLKMTKTSELTDDFAYTGVTSNSMDWRLAHVIALTAKISSVLSLKVSNAIRYLHSPVPGFKSTDTTTSVALVAKFAKQ